MDFILNKHAPLYVLSSLEAQEIMEDASALAKAKLTVCSGENYVALIGDNVSVFVLPANGSIQNTWSEDVCTDKILILTFLDEKITKRQEIDLSADNVTSVQLINVITNQTIHPTFRAISRNSQGMSLLPIRPANGLHELLC